MLTGISSTFLQNRSRYYAQLEAASRGLDIDKWLAWFAQMTLAAQDQTVAWASFLIGKAQLMSRLQGLINMRQEKVLIRLFKAGPQGFVGGLSAENYRTISGATSATATRDLADLVERSALRRTGERKGTRYWLTVT
jgi:Fic family protein